MQVETYEATEVYDGENENREEAAKLADKLGLQGQARYLGTEEKSENPYRKMTREEWEVYNALCPRSCKIQEYSDGPIPLRILQVAAHATDLFDKIMVLYPQSADIDDPVLFGLNGNEYSGERFLLARWGNCLLPFSQLRDMASVHIKASIMTKMQIIKSEVDSKLSVLEQMTGAQVLAISDKNPYFNFSI